LKNKNQAISLSGYKRGKFANFLLARSPIFIMIADSLFFYLFFSALQKNQVNTLNQQSCI
jgi:hypothetical protein